MPVPSKESYPTYYQGGGSTYSVSPPEMEASVSSGSGSGMAPSYSNSGYSAASPSYAGSAVGDLDSVGSAGGVDFQEYMQ